MNYNQASAYLASLERIGIKLGLKSPRKLLKLLGNPEKELNMIHVAGTNGKGSTCAILSEILQRAGFRVGVYTSPHFVRATERITINTREIPKTDLAQYLSRIRPYVTGQTYFEVLTALAFLYFMEKKVDFAIVEVGMGGRLDATNVAAPLISIITNISKEHIRHLGSTIRKIAREKAGIVKKRVPVVTGAEGTALSVVRRVCRIKRAALYIVEKASGYKTNLNGDFQQKNIAVALKAIKVLKEHYGDRIRGLRKINSSLIANALVSVRLRGRAEFARNMLIDCAHNPAGMKEISGYIREIRRAKKIKKVITVFGALSDKDYRRMLSELLNISDYLIFTEPKSKRALDPRKILRSFNRLKHKKKPGRVIIDDVKQAVNHARSLSSGHDLVFVTGSCYVAGEALLRK